MSFNIEEFKSNIESRGGLLRSNKFRVRLFPPNVLRSSVARFRDLTFFAEQVVAPGINLSTHDVRRYGYGPIEKRPMGHTFTDINVTFLQDANGESLRIFYDWIESISSFNFNRPENQPYLFDYRANYVSTMEVEQFNDQGEVIQLIQLREVFPISIADQPFNWSDYNTFQRLTVQFAFTDWNLPE